MGNYGNVDQEYPALLTRAADHKHEAHSPLKIVVVERYVWPAKTPADPGPSPWAKVGDVSVNILGLEMVRPPSSLPMRMPPCDGEPSCFILIRI